MAPMSGRGLRVRAVAIAALLIVGAAVYLVVRQVADPRGRGEGGPDPADEGTASTAGITDGADSLPAGQLPVTRLTVEEFQGVFNASCDEARLLVMLSPT
jgi:hypothetical protein